MNYLKMYIGILALSFFLIGCSNNLSSMNKNSELVIQQNQELNSNNEVKDEHEHEHDQEHNHQTYEEQQIYKGYFEDEKIDDRPLSDWEGDWQSVYPYLQDGTLDEVFEYKAAKSEAQSFEDIKTYYDLGYQTTTDRIVIENNFITFYDHGHAHTGEYKYDGYEILTYEKGNRGVRFIFKHVGDEEGVPAYIQFSDHIIAPKKSDHFHLYWGNDRQALLEEVTNWPTYYPFEMNGHSIAHEMMAH